MAVTYYSWEDTGAPQMTVTRNVSGNYQNNINEIMDAILLTGYGSKPGMGWTKLMTSEVEGSNRTVYQNNSAHSDNMNLIIESNKAHKNGFSMQIADVITSPEIFAGYSQIVSLYQVHGGNEKWHAIGDERTLIFLYWSSFTDAISPNYWDSYAPSCIYAGDFDSPHNNNSKAWGLIGPAMYAGKIGEIGTAGTIKGTFNFNVSKYPYDKNHRPITQVPGEEWSEGNATVFTASFEGRHNFSNKTEAPYRSTDDFVANAQIRSDWFIIFNQNIVYRLRGIYNIYPWLSHNDTSNKRLWGKIVHVFDDDYIPFTWFNSRSYYVPMSVYIKATGDW